MTSSSFPFHDESECQRYLLAKRWPEGLTCKRCQKAMVYKPKTLTFKCSTCGQHPSPTSGTVFHKSRLPLLVWFKAMHLMLASPTGVSALHLQKQLHLRSYRAAWRMAHKIRLAMALDVNVPLHVDTDKHQRFVTRNDAFPTVEGKKKKGRSSGTTHGWSSKYHRAYSAEHHFRAQKKGSLEAAFDHLLTACIVTPPSETGT